MSENKTLLRSRKLHMLEQVDKLKHKENILLLLLLLLLLLFIVVEVVKVL